MVMQQVHRLKQNNTDLENDLKLALNHQISNNTPSDEKQAWAREKAVLESQLVDLREKLAGLENTALDSMSRAEELTNDVKQLEDDREILIADRQKYKSRYNEHKKEARRHIQDLTEEIERLSEALENTNTALEHTNTELDETRLMNQKLKKDLDSVKTQKVADASSPSPHDWEQQQAQYEDEIAQREQQVHNLTLERQALQQQYKDAQHKIELLLEQLDDLSTNGHHDVTNHDDDYPRDEKRNSLVGNLAAA
jgi:predicted RNase H-like nuclease (RuvC/YqgF family)